MSVFIGDYNCKLDSKGRFMLPAALKKQLPAEAGGAFIVKKDIFENCLNLIPKNEWEKQIAVLRNKVNPYNPEHSKFLREFFRGTAEVRLDLSGRLLIPKKLTEEINIDKNICLCGQDTKIEIWVEEKYKDTALKAEDLAELAKKVMGNLEL